MKIGDVVVLKSGGPRMVAQKIDKEEEGNEVTCRWFIGSVCYTDVFLESGLEVVPSKTSKKGK